MAHHGSLEDNSPTGWLVGYNAYCVAWSCPKAWRLLAAQREWYYDKDIMFIQR